MKKLLFVVMFALSIPGCLYSQEEVDTLTNSSVLKMVMSNLSDDIIIEEISISYPDFNISEDSTKFLSSENVSENVIQAMKSAVKDKLAKSSVTEVTGLQENIIKEDTTLFGSSLKNDTVNSESTVENQKDASEIPLENRLILDMVKAKFSDEIIIKEISISKVNFNLSNDSLNILLSQNVSEQVIQAMKSAVDKQMKGVFESSEQQKIEIPFTNNYVLNMVKANISDEDIINEINISKVNFDISEDSINLLLSKNVSDKIIAVMKNAVNKQFEKRPEISFQNKLDLPVIFNENDSVIELKGFVIPLKGLIEFYENDYFIVSDQLQKWNETVKLSNIRFNEIDSMISEDKKQLFNYKIANSNKYTFEVTSQKSTLIGHRDILKQHKIERVNEGKQIIEELKQLYKDVVSMSILKYREVSSSIRSKNCTPSTWGNAVQSSLKVLTINTDNIEKCIFPASELLYFDKNERKTLLEDILIWNNEIIKSIQEYEELSKKLEQAESFLTVYKLDSNKYKAELSMQKKKCSSLRKNMNNLQTKMKEDSKVFSRSIKQKGADFKESLNERYLEIADCINNEYIGL